MNMIREKSAMKDDDILKTWKRLAKACQCLRHQLQKRLATDPGLSSHLEITNNALSELANRTLDSTAQLALMTYIIRLKAGKSTRSSKSSKSRASTSRTI